MCDPAGKTRGSGWILTSQVPGCRRLRRRRDHLAVWPELPKPV